MRCHFFLHYGWFFQNLGKEAVRTFMHTTVAPKLHRDAFCQFPFLWIYYYGSNKSTGKETGKTHLCAVTGQELFFAISYSKLALTTFSVSVFFLCVNKHLVKFYLNTIQMTLAPGLTCECPGIYTLYTYIAGLSGLHF